MAGAARGPRVEEPQRSLHRAVDHRADVGVRIDRKNHVGLYSGHQDIVQVEHGAGTAAGGAATRGGQIHTFQTIHELRMIHGDRNGIGRCVLNGNLRVEKPAVADRASAHAE